MVSGEKLNYATSKFLDIYGIERLERSEEYNFRRIQIVFSLIGALGDQKSLTKATNN